MIRFPKPRKLDGAQLIAELTAAGVMVTNDRYSVHIDGDDQFWLDIQKADTAKAATVVAAHVGINAILNP